MNRAMFSGVAGMKAHQTKMDVIGNNIANVNTYGYKSQRAVFSDIYYQTLRGASGGSSSRGGINPSSVGYGATLSAVQTQMTQSSMQNTGFGMDVAITGEGFLQVMDPDGNIFYTKAGMLDYDANGYLTDINGNFVLGATDVDGKPGTQKIKLDNIGSVDAKQPADTQLINGVNYTVTASNASKYGNVAFNIGVSEDLPAGQKAAATISTTGGITVQLNATEKFSSMTELNQAVNDAIIEANGGKSLAAGTFTITADKNLFGNSASNGTFIGSAEAKDTTFQAGEGFFGGAFDIKNFTLAEAVTADVNQPFKIVSDGATTPTYTISTTIGAKLYSGTFQGNISQGSTVTLTTTGTPSGSITLDLKDKTKLNSELSKFNTGAAEVTSDKTTLTAPTYFLGGAKISSVSNNFSNSGTPAFTCTVTSGKLVVKATVNGVTYSNEDAPLALGSAGSITLRVQGGDDAVNGTINMSIPSKDDIKKHLGVTNDADLETKLNASAGKHTYKLVAATSGSVEPLTGAEIGGGNFGVTGGKVEGMNALFGGMTFMKTSSDFNGSGTVSSVKATYDNTTDPTNPFWRVSLTVGGKTYSSDITESTKASSLLLKSSDGDYIQVSNPGFDAISDSFKVQNGGNPPADGEVVEGLEGGKELTITPAEASRQLGLSTVGFALVGGTEGGAITLDQLSSISIGSDGTVTVNHAEKGTVSAGKISLATFSNPAGLQLVGNNYYTTTANSGDAKLADPGSGGTGALKSSALEMSNVDLSAEFADMITTQRGFQANSRIITVSDTMLEELINLKR